MNGIFFTAPLAPLCFAGLRSSANRQESCAQRLI
jgi:hypothetical protein